MSSAAPATPADYNIAFDLDPSTIQLLSGSQQLTPQQKLMLQQQQQQILLQQQQIQQQLLELEGQNALASRQLAQAVTASSPISSNTLLHTATHAFGPSGSAGRRRPKSDGLSGRRSETV